MDTASWYAMLLKPSWAPAAWLFGPVWTVLYVIMAASFGTVFYKFFKKEIPARVALPFALNIVFNVAYSPIQFGLQNNLLAALDILLVLGTLVWGMVAIWRLAPRSFSGVGWVALANIPYLLWVSFATVLQLTITYLNF
ncbi:MAG: tryptophan-rich sensory protein [Candidatus Zambryskibacteria bacterium]|nr:tryptophan-rich sensory protein [Candidatus Zambryskibacteria bacterium]